MILRITLLILTMVLGWAMPGAAQDYGPEIPKASGEPHPEGNDYMRRWHMEMMKHDRDITMYQGIRPAEASLGQCFDCHTVKDDLGKPVTYTDDRHFCRTCHDYVAVRVDCFDCHRSTPEGFEEPAPHASLNWFRRMLPVPSGQSKAEDVLQAYLAEIETEKTE